MADGKEMQQDAIGIIVGGGPAPGINGVIAAVTIEARNNGLKVFGFLQGFKYLMSEGANNTNYLSLHIRDVSRIHFAGGSILRTSRANPTKKEETMTKTIECLDALNIKYLVTIGGDDTAFSSMSVAKATNGRIHVCHVPKTIDNDLPLPRGIPTFGFQTAREFGASVVRNLMEDAKTAARYFIVIAMGRQAGHLALGIGKSAGAHLTLIPEEFTGNTTFSRICDIIEGTVIKRQMMGKEHGVVVLAEGLVEHMLEEDIIAAFGKEDVKFDPHGHILLSELDIGKKIRDEMRQRLPGVGFTEKNLGYEVRCAPPTAFDREYTRDLGYGAVKYLLSGGNGALITSQGGTMVPIPFDEVKDPETGKTRTRKVDITGEGFEVACKYMIRLTKKDFQEPETLNQLAATANISVDDFRAKFGFVVNE